MNATQSVRNPRSDVLVVGGGLAGLTAAALAARTGLTVQLVERAAHLGGRAATTEVEGYHLNLGPHALYRRGAALRIWKGLGLEMGARPAPARGAALRRGELHRLPVDALSLLSTGLLGWADKSAAAALLRQIPRLNVEPLAHTSVTEWLRSVTPSPAVREVLAAYIRLSTYSNCPDVFSAKTAIARLQGAQGGVFYIDGGWQSLVRGLAGIAEGNGTRILSGAGARTLSRLPDGRYTLSLHDNQTLASDVVILAVSPSEAARLVESAGGRAPAAVTAARAVRMATLDVALRRLPGNGPRFVLGIDQPLYLSVHSDVAALAPAGGAVIHTGKYLAESDDPDTARAELEALLDRTHPGWRRELVHAQHLPRMKAAERLDLAAEGGEAGRPEPECPGLPGVLLAGDWVRGGEWLVDAAAAAGEQAASLTSRLLLARRAVA